MKFNIILAVTMLISSVAYADMELHISECSLPNVIKEAQALTNDKDTKKSIENALTKTIVTIENPLSRAEEIYAARDFFNKLELKSTEIVLKGVSGKFDLKKVSYRDVSCTRLNTPSSYAQ